MPGRNLSKIRGCVHFPLRRRDRRGCQRLNQQTSPAPAPNSEDALDPAELIEDFEHPICQFCMGTGMVRDENGIHMVRCDYCEGEGRAPAPE